MKKYLFLAPLILLFGLGVYVRTIRSLMPNVASRVTDYSGEIDRQALVGKYHGKEVVVPQEMLAETWREQHVLGVANPTEKWVEVDLSEQKLWAWDGNALFLETLVSTGLPWWPTPTGEFRIWVKLRATKMEGGSGRYYYYLPNVPYVMFFESESVPRWRGFSLHGTYWHNDFGTVHSHGCVNLPTPMAEKLYYWVYPVLPEGKLSIFASEENLGTRIVIHD